MKMRPLGKTGIMVSEIGLGCEHLQGMKYEQIRDVLDAAEECGINAMDTFMSQMEVRRDIGRALRGRRERFIIQGHIGSVWTDGQYKRSRDLAESKAFFEDYLAKYGTDYIDIGMLHFVDDDDDWDDDEIYFVVDELQAYIPQLRFEPLSNCAGVLTL